MNLSEFLVLLLSLCRATCFVLNLLYLRVVKYFVLESYFFRNAIRLTRCFYPRILSRILMPNVGAPALDSKYACLIG